MVETTGFPWIFRLQTLQTMVSCRASTNEKPHDIIHKMWWDVVGDRRVDDVNADCRQRSEGHISWHFMGCNWEYEQQYGDMQIFVLGCLAVLTYVYKNWVSPKSGRLSCCSPSIPKILGSIFGFKEFACASISHSRYVVYNDCSSRSSRWEADPHWPR